MKNNRLIYILVVLVVIISTFMPGVMLKTKEKNMLDKVVVDNNAYYYRGAADTQLKLYERLKLACNQWESNVEIIDISQSDKTFSQVVDMAEKGMSVLYNTGFYPTKVVSTYNNWYSPSIKLYRYSDSYFNKYTCDVWYITLIKYDNSEKHTLLIENESGMVIAAKCEIDENSDLDLKFRKQEISGIIGKYKKTANIYNSTNLDLATSDIYVGKYGLIEEQYSTTYSTLSMLSEHNVSDYQQAVEEVKNSVDNNKYFIAEYGGKNYFYYKLIPFSIGADTKSE